MKELVGKYVVYINETSVVISPTTKYCKLKTPVRLDYNELTEISLPKYVLDFIQRKRRYSGTLYLIHFDEPYKHARHYLGFTKDLESRIKSHQAGSGANLMKVITEAGISWQVVRVWYGDRHLERKLKKHSSTRYCPICTNSA